MKPERDIGKSIFHKVKQFIDCMCQFKLFEFEDSKLLSVHILEWICGKNWLVQEIHIIFIDLLVGEVLDNCDIVI